jgi:hypothetical protein
MSSGGFAQLAIEVEQGNKWISIITLKVMKDTKAGENTVRLQARVAP